MLVGGVAAGLFGSLLGLGGGLLIVPLLTLGFGLPLREAVGVSLVCVIVTSSASAGMRCTITLSPSGSHSKGEWKTPFKRSATSPGRSSRKRREFWERSFGTS